MKIQLSKSGWAVNKSNTLSIILFEDNILSDNIIKLLSKNFEFDLASLLEKEMFKAKSKETFLLHTFSKMPADKILFIGAGKKMDFTLDKYRKICGQTAKIVEKNKINELEFCIPYIDIKEFNLNTLVKLTCEGLKMGTYSFTKYQTEQNEPQIFKTTYLTLHPDYESASIENEILNSEVEKSSKLIDSVFLARDLINEPSNTLTPSELAKRAYEMAETTGLKVKVYEKEEMEKMGMNLLLAVSKGSFEPPKLIHLSYTPKNNSNDNKKLVLVGKGLTFDSGGLCLKPAASMESMKCDMSGSAAVMGAMQYIAWLKPDFQVDGVIGAVENMPGSKAVKPGDVIKSYNGKTVEIFNTDAEGRLVLADAITFAVKQNATKIIELSTLTGACVVALGPHISGVLGTSQSLIDNILKAATEAGENMWQLPLSDTLNDNLKSDLADMKNSGPKTGGAIFAGLFLKKFTDDVPFVHIDIAGPAFSDKDQDLTTKGGTGYGVKTVAQYIENLIK